MTSLTSAPTIALSDGTEIPQLGFGVFQIPEDETVEAVRHALEAGYRHIDTAKAYGNEAEVGEAVRAFGEPVYVTTKLWNSDQGADAARAAFDASFERLGLDHVDLYLIHWPVPSQGKYVETWQTLLELRESDRLRSAGVSNFQPAHLDAIVEATGVTPVINQIELHPYLQQRELREYHAAHGIVTEAWSPLAQGEVLDDPVLTEIAEAHGKSSGQVVLRWHIQLGNVVFPKSATPERIRENFAIFDFELSDDQMAAIESLDKGERTGPDPDTMDVT
ncbi:MAG: 2,5-diketo-D-gluconate reductase [Solirubrobacteraceae bacterium]|nr:2,5-diketo-D-gluconate reductase [Solirubrobacteraceae bacterium]